MDIKEKELDAFKIVNEVFNENKRKYSVIQETTKNLENIKKVIEEIINYVEVNLHIIASSLLKKQKENKELFNYEKDRTSRRARLSPRIVPKQVYYIEYKRHIGHKLGFLDSNYFYRVDDELVGCFPDSFLELVKETRNFLEEELRIFYDSERGFVKRIETNSKTQGYYSHTRPMTTYLFYYNKKRINKETHTLIIDKYDIDKLIEKKKIEGIECETNIEIPAQKTPRDEQLQTKITISPNMNIDEHDVLLCDEDVWKAIKEILADLDKMNKDMRKYLENTKQGLSNMFQKSEYGEILFLNQLEA